MTEDRHPDGQAAPRSRRKLWIALIALAVVLVLLIVPPFISINRYKSRITQLISTALQRPVRLSGVGLRILPRPEFVIDDFTVQEDPAYGAEPVLHANTVNADIRLWSLWRGQLQISRIDVDEASLNLVHAPDGRWNIDDLFHTAAAQQRSAGQSAVPFPYMEATNSRINVNDGLEKLPFSLMNADASLWKESDGTWRVRLRGQPARTDVSLDLADTGVVRVEAALHPATRLEGMPLHVDLDWREAQLGQLSRLVLGSDAGWRGDLRGELHLDGTVESAKVQARLRATGVHRAEFAPAAPLDFDATCSFVFQSDPRSLRNLACDSPVGSGRARIAGDVALSGITPDLTIALDRVPAQAALDLLRTVRSDLNPGLQAAGTVSGDLKYQPAAAPGAQPARSRKARRGARVAGPLTGSLTVQGLSISGGPLNQPVQVAKLVLEPTPSEPAVLAATVPVSAGAPAPLAVSFRIALHGFEVSAHGPASLARLRELAGAAGFAQASVFSQISGEPAVVNLTAQGPWLPSILAAGGGNGSMSGTVALREAHWNPDFLAGPVLLPAATLHFENGGLNWDPVAFTFGPVKGTASLAVAATCDPGAACPPQFTVHFATLDAAALQAALLGAQQRGTLLSTLLARFTSSSKLWPALDGSVQADAMQLGPFALHNVEADVHILPTGAEITSFGAAALGGQVSGTADLTVGDKPAYKINADFAKINPAQAGQLAGMKWAGGAMDGSAHLELSGYSAADLGSSAVGTLHFTWSHGSVAGAGKGQASAAPGKFDAWTADATIAHGAITLGKNELLRGKRQTPVAGSLQFGSPAVVSFTAQGSAKSRAR